jgi:hypothetical protein
VFRWTVLGFAGFLLIILLFVVLGERYGLLHPVQSPSAQVASPKVASPKADTSNITPPINAPPPPRWDESTDDQKTDQCEAVGGKVTIDGRTLHVNGCIRPYRK